MSPDPVAVLPPGFDLLPRVAKKPWRFGWAGGPFPSLFQVSLRYGRRLSFSARQQAFYCKGGLSGRLTCAGLWPCLPVIPGHPVRRVLGQFLGVFLQFDQVLEGIDAV